MEHRRPKAGDGPHEGLLKVEKREFRCLGLGVQGLGFMGQGLGFRVQVFRVQGLGFRSFRV